MAWHWRKVTHGRVIAVHMCCSYSPLGHHQVLSLRETQQIQHNDGRHWSQRWGLLGNRRRLELKTIASNWRDSANISSPNGKGNVDFYSAYRWNISKTLRYSTYFRLHTLRFILKRNEPYLPLPSQPQLVLIYRPLRNGMLSRPWCEVAPVEIRTCNLPFANPALYHTATSALPRCDAPSDLWTGARRQNKRVAPRGRKIILY